MAQENFRTTVGMQAKGVAYTHYPACMRKVK